MINFFFASDDNTRYHIQENLLNEQDPFFYSGTGWSRVLEPFINADHFGIVCYYTFTGPNKQSRMVIILLVRGAKPDSILRCFKLINKSVIRRAFALFQKKSDQDSDYIVKEFILYYGHSIRDAPPPSAPPSSSQPSYAPQAPSDIFPLPREVEEEDNGVYEINRDEGYGDDRSADKDRQIVARPQENRDNHHPLGLYNEYNGGKKKVEPKKTKAKYTYNKREYIVYDGARGGKYIRLNKEFVSIKKLKP